MSKRKGLSADEKRRVILDIYHSQKEPFNLKEIEGLASKRGVVLQTIKDQNKSLLDDSLIMSDKIGSSVFFWSFPSQVLHEKKLKINQLREAVNAASVRCNQESKKREMLLLDRVAVDRAAKLQRLADVTKELEEVSAELAADSVHNPEVVRQIVSDAQSNKAAADRWTENVWAVKKYLVRKRGQSGKEVDKMLGIDGDFDYLCFPQKRK